ncbi:hypothetical protein NC652_026386 [Populus alba x Populus x berolinensis]|uniref:Uncharacterized protein n=1 Tax=Populus alba x Populus x berolinensis TaxID=444605 RepID=A0AAD6QAK4_9ROSI|nr:hypothetical protein NC652_026386 [Populus alba x Populus x berolinensis]KAJ6983003.1 hypothetical protein NC653_025965 [Populus alba x Populus x berolinensis]
MYKMSSNVKYVTQMSPSWTTYINFMKDMCNFHKKNPRCDFFSKISRNWMLLAWGPKPF